MTRLEYETASRRLLVEAWDTAPTPRTVRGVTTRYRRLVNTDETLSTHARTALLEVFPPIFHRWGLEKLALEVQGCRRWKPDRELVH